MLGRFAILTDRLRKAWIYRWIGLAGAALFGVVSSGGVMMLPEYYISDTRIQIVDWEDETLRQALGKTQIELLSDEVLMELVESNPESFGVDRNDESNSVSAIAALLSRDIKFVFVDEITTDIECRSAEAARARDICRIFLEEFNDRIEENYNAESEARLDEFERLSNELDDVTRELIQLREQNVGLTDQGEIERRAQAAVAELDAAQSAYAAALKQRNNLRDIYLSQDDERSKFMKSMLPQSNGNARLDRLYNLHEELEELRARYSETHPDVVVVLRQLTSLAEQYPPDIAICSGQKLDPEQNTSLSRPMDLVTISVIAANILLCAAETDVVFAQLNLNAIRNGIDTMFPIQQEIARLTDRQYELRLRVDEQARLIQLSEGTDLARKYLVVSRPGLPSAPSGPPPEILLFAALIGSIGAGIFIAQFLGATSEIFTKSSDIEEQFVLPLYGTVSKVKGIINEIDDSARALSFWGLAGAFIAAMLALIVFEPLVGAIEDWITTTLSVGQGLIGSVLQWAGLLVSK